MELIQSENHEELIFLNDPKKWIQEFKQKLWGLCKTNLRKDTFIDKFQRRHVNNNRYMVFFTFSTIYEIFKISLRAQINFQLSSQVTIMINIKSHEQVMQKFPEMQVTIKGLNDILRKQDRNFVYDISAIEGVRVTERTYFYDLKNSTTFAKEIMKKLDLPIAICNSLLIDLQMKIQIPFNVSISSQFENIINHFKNFRLMGLLQKEGQRFIQIFKEQSRLKNCLQNPNEIAKRNNQVMRNIILYDTPARQRKNMNQEVNVRYKGSFSSLEYIRDYATWIETMIYSRKEIQNQNPNYEYNRKQAMIQLICKTPTNESNAIRSYQNERFFLDKKGGKINKYICNYYDQITQQGQSAQRRNQDKKQICSEYHEWSVQDKFYTHGVQFSMRDIINFAEQTMTGLIEFYLSQGYLHRDIKELNILISRQGAIQIIDQGSVFIFDSQDRTSQQEEILSREKQQLDPILRSTIYVRYSDYKKNLQLMTDYQNFEIYLNCSKTHHTFDVYSVGVMLSEMVKDHESFCGPKWMQISQRWNCLTEKMTHKDPVHRISMQQALEQIKILRSFIFPY